ncbi:MAG: hypothetical protein M5R36_05370 [Deltaproteobacteria bacterium]|nr:hypothetical protein [Deltaproteobacteria bacterium]
MKPVYTYAANVEYNFPNERVLTAALIHSFIGDYDGDLIGEPTYPLLLVAWRASFFRERLETEGAFAYDFSALDNRQWRDGDIFGEDGQVSPVFTWKLTDPVHVGAGANLFWGDDGSLFGFMKSRSRVFTFANYNF